MPKTSACAAVSAASADNAHDVMAPTTTAYRLNLLVTAEDPVGLTLPLCNTVNAIVNDFMQPDMVGYVLHANTPSSTPSTLCDFTWLPLRRRFRPAVDFEGGILYENVYVATTTMNRTLAHLGTRRVLIGLRRHIQVKLGRSFHGINIDGWLRNEADVLADTGDEEEGDDEGKEDDEVAHNKDESGSAPPPRAMINDVFGIDATYINGEEDGEDDRETTACGEHTEAECDDVETQTRAETQTLPQVEVDVDDTSSTPDSDDSIPQTQTQIQTQPETTHCRRPARLIRSNAVAMLTLPVSPRLIRSNAVTMLTLPVSPTVSLAETSSTESPTPPLLPVRHPNTKKRRVTDEDRAIIARLTGPAIKRARLYE